MPEQGGRSSRRPRLGAHMSIAGGIDKAVLRGASIGCETIQIFTKNSNQWKARPMESETVTRFLAYQKDLGIAPVVAHDSYLINLASPDDELWSRSISALAEELERCEMLSVPGLVMHPGSHTGSGEEAGLARISEALNLVFDRLPGCRVQAWLETTAGQGSSLGYRFQHLKEILSWVKEPDRVAFCFDTAHVHAAGYDLCSEEGYQVTIDDFDRTLGLSLLRAFHLNDSRRERGSRVDRHAHIGKGTLGLTPFRFLLNDSRFSDTPMILETPKGPDMVEDVENLTLLRSLFEMDG